MIKTRLSFANTWEMRHVLNHIVWVGIIYDDDDVVKIKSVNCAF